MSARRVLYRKYRPTSLDDVVGQEQVTSALSNSLQQGKISHAYLFIGPRGTGKTSVARILAHAVNDFPYGLEDDYLDIIEIDAASNTGVDNIRDLREKAIVAPSKGKYKVYIIDEVHMLSKSAANALLKTLEEPPEHVIFIMATTEAHKIPITISSRTQVYNFQLASPEVMLQHLRKISDLEQLKITDDALRLIARRGGGSFRDSLSLLDQVITLTDQEITADLLTQAFGLPQEQAISQILSAYASGDSATVQSLLRGFINSGLRPETVASELLTSIVASPTAETLPLLESLPDVQPPFPEAKLLLALLSGSQLPQQPISQPAPAASPTPPSPRPAAPTSPPAPTPITTSEPPASAPSVDPASSEPALAAPSDSPPAPTPPKPQAPTVSVSDFAWDQFIEAVHDDNNAVYMQLRKTEHELIDGTLHIYPLQKFTAKILKKPENSQVIAKHIGEIAFVVHDFENRQPTKDSTLSQISAIMGDVREVNGEMPF